MKIWIQSGTPLGRSQLYKPYSDSLIRHAQRASRPGTIVDFPPLGRDYPGAGRSRTHLHFVQHETIKGALRAQAEGYDAFITNCLDLGFYELREMVDIPVIFMTQATLAFYSQLTPNFAFLVNSERLLHYFKDIAIRYQVNERMLPGSFVSFAFTDYAKLWSSPQPFIDQFTHVAKSLAASGATAFCPAGLYLSQWLIDQGIRTIDGSLIMDPLAVSIKTAEVMIELKQLGIEPYQAGSWTRLAPDVRELLANEFNLYK